MSGRTRWLTWRGIAGDAATVEPFDHFAHVFRSAFDHRAILVLIAQHEAVIALREFLQAGADALAVGAGGENLFHEVVDFLLCKGNKARGALLTALALLHLGVVIVADAVGAAAGFFGDAFEHGLERQTQLLRLVGRLPQEVIFVVAPARPSARSRNRLFHLFPLQILC